MLTSIGGLRNPSAGLMLCALASLLTSCTMMTRTGAIDTSDINRICSVWPYVTWSSKDQLQTIREVKAANAAKDGFCKETKP